MLLFAKYASLDSEDNLSCSKEQDAGQVQLVNSGLTDSVQKGLNLIIACMHESDEAVSFKELVPICLRVVVLLGSMGQPAGHSRTA